jgi:hypothetical protein
MTQYSFRDANRRHRAAFIPLMVLYAALCFLGRPVLLLAWESPPLWSRASVALLTALPIVAVFWFLYRYVRETDEFTRALQLESIAIGAFITVSLGVAWGFLELFAVVPPAWAFWAGPVFFAAYGLAYAVRMRHFCRASDA